MDNCNQGNTPTQELPVQDNDQRSSTKNFECQLKLKELVPEFVRKYYETYIQAVKTIENCEPMTRSELYDAILELIDDITPEVTAISCGQIKIELGYVEDVGLQFSIGIYANSEDYIYDTE